MTSPPAIRIARDRCYAGQPAGDSRSGTATPMAIPRAREPVPPPLPPPTVLPDQDFGWQFGNSPNDASFGRPVTLKPGSSLLGNSLLRQGKEHDHSTPAPFDQQRRNSSMSTITQGHDHNMTDESLANLDKDVYVSTPASNTELKGEKELGQKALELSSQTYDKQLLSRMGGPPNTVKRQSLPYSPTSAPDGGQVTNGIERRHSALQVVNSQEKRHSSLDASSGVKWSASWALSFRSTPLWKELGTPESNNTSRHGSLVSDETGSHRGSYDHSMFVNDDFYMGEGQLSHLYIDDQSPGSPKAGSKRRASSPPREREDRSSISSATGQSEAFQRRSIHQMPNRTSPVSRQPDQASISSASSIGARHGSLGSSLGMASVPSSATSYGSSRASPSFTSPANDADSKKTATTGALNGTLPSTIIANHQRTLSESAPSVTRKLSADSGTHSRKTSILNMPGGYMCECCPKKPKRFDTEEELRSHENEKQYTCSFCLHRFKNKNEAERHQNSLHLRRQSWSCAALSGIEAAYHTSSSPNGSDVCGYCGQEFSNPPQWDHRAEHLNHVHKFGECNQAKKFFRADHFRQHLKHSHQGASGKWTNVLEHACMKEEPLEKRGSPTDAATPTGRAPPALKISTMVSGPGPPAPATETIEETPHDS